MSNLPDLWINLIQEGDYKKLAEVTAVTEDLNKKLITSIWHARALRAMNQGAMANNALINTARNKFAGSVEEIASFAEELVQCAFYEDAIRLANMMEEAGAVEAQYVMAIVWREREFWSKSNGVLDKLQTYGEPWETLSNIQRAWNGIRQGRYTFARSLLEKFINNPQPAISKLIVRLDLAVGDWKKAQERLQTLANEQPLDWEWPALMASALIQRSKYKNNFSSRETQQSINSFFELSLLRQPRQPETLVNRARWRLINSDVAGSKVDCSAALEIKPWLDIPILIWVEQAITERNYTKANSILEQARAQLDTPRRAGAALDLMRFQRVKKKELVNSATSLTKKFSDDATAFRTAGAAMQFAKKYDLAIAYYSKSLELIPDDFATKNNLALLYREQGDLNEALITWKSFIEKADSAILCNYALTLIQHGDKLQAEKIFTNILKTEPQNAVALRGLAEIQFEVGDDEKAWQFAQASLKVDPKNPLAWIVSAMIAGRQGGEAKAVELLLQGEQQAIPKLEVRHALFQKLRSQLNYVDLQKKIQAWYESEPEEEKYWLMAADAADDFNDFKQCEAMLLKAQNCNGDYGSEMLMRFYLRRNRQGAAKRVAEQLVRANPDIQTNWALLAEVLYKQERYKEAHEAVDAGLKINPTRFSLVQLKVGFYLAREEFAEAIEIARNLFKTKNNKENLSLLVGTLRRSQKYHEILDLINETLDKDPKDQLIRLMQVTALQRVGNHEEALERLKDLYSDEPDNAIVVQQYALALVAAYKLPAAIEILQQFAERSGYRPNVTSAVAELMGREGGLVEAISLLDTAINRSPTSLELWVQKASLQKLSDDVVEEMDTWREVLARFPAKRWSGFGIPALVRLGLISPMQEALNAWREMEPNNPEPWWAAFYAAKEMKKDEMALEFLERIEKFRGVSVKVYSERAQILQENWHLSLAASMAQKAIELRPAEPYLYEQLIHIMVKAGNFDEFDKVMKKLGHMRGDEQYLYYANFFFNINCHPTWSGEQVWRFYSDWYNRAIKPNLPPFIRHKNSPDPQRRLRIGYVSPDLRRHAVAYFSEPLLMHHDRDQFELFAYSYLESGTADKYTDRFKSYFHHWIEIRNMSDDELDRRIRADGIDILIDLAGHTTNNKLKAFIRQPAPLQASWLWGAGQTTGLPQVNFLFGDACSLPPSFEAYCAEQVRRLPEPGFCFKPAEDVLDPMPLPSLEKGFITFGVLARPLRTNRLTINVWAKILHRIPNSVLRFDHIPYAEPDVQQRLISYFKELEIESDRLIFLNTRPHWKVYQEIDLQLDPFPAGSITTVTEGLFMERLVVTLRSRPPMGRMVDSQLQAMGLASLCCANTPEDYIEKVVTLSADIPRLAELSIGLRERMKSSRLMDYVGYGRDVAAMYRLLWQEWCRNQIEMK